MTMHNRDVYQPRFQFDNELRSQRREYLELNELRCPTYDADVVEIPALRRFPMCGGNCPKKPPRRGR